MPHSALTVLAHARALHWLYWTLHWQAQGNYAEHLLFERLYKDMEEEIDSLAEKVIDTRGNSAVEVPESITLTRDVLLSWEQDGHLGPEKALEANRQFLDLLESTDVESRGFNNLLDDISDTHETHSYLLKQHLMGTAMTKTAAGIFDRFDFFGNDEPSEPAKPDMQHLALRDFERQAGGHAELLPMDSSIMKDSRVIDATNHRFYYISPHKAWFLWLDLPQSESVRLGVRAYKGLVGRRNLHSSIPALHEVPLWVGTSDGKAVKVPNPTGKSAATSSTNPVLSILFVKVINKFPKTKAALKGGKVIVKAPSINPLVDRLEFVGLDSRSSASFMFYMKDGTSGWSWNDWPGDPPIGFRRLTAENWVSLDVTSGSSLEQFEKAVRDFVSPLMNEYKNVGYIRPRESGLKDRYTVEEWMVISRARYHDSLAAAAKEKAEKEALAAKLHAEALARAEAQREIDQGKPPTVGDITRDLKYLSLGTFGKVRAVASIDSFTWALEPSQRQRQDSFQSDDGYDPDRWYGQYVYPLKQAVKKALDSNFGPGILEVEDVDEKGFVYVKMTRESRAMYKVASKNKAAQNTTSPLEEIPRKLKSIRLGPFGPIHSVVPAGKARWSLEPDGRMRMDSFMKDDYDDYDDFGESRWEEAYAKPLRQILQKALDTTFGADFIKVSGFDDKGFVYVELTPKSRTVYKVGGKTASEWLRPDFVAMLKQILDSVPGVDVKIYKNEGQIEIRSRSNPQVAGMVIKDLDRSHATFTLIMDDASSWEPSEYSGWSWNPFPQLFNVGFKNRQGGNLIRQDLLPTDPTKLKAAVTGIAKTLLANYEETGWVRPDPHSNKKYTLRDWKALQEEAVRKSLREQQLNSRPALTDIAKTLKHLNLGAFGKVREVFPEDRYAWSLDPTQRMRQDSFRQDDVYEDDEMSQDMWHEAYAAPLERAVEKSLKARFGPDFLEVEGVDEKGFVTVVLTPNALKAYKASGKTAGPDKKLKGIKRPTLVQAFVQWFNKQPGWKAKLAPGPKIVLKRSRINLLVDRIEISDLDKDSWEYRIYLMNGMSGWSWYKWDDRNPGFHNDPGYNKIWANKIDDPDVVGSSFVRALDGLKTNFESWLTSTGLVWILRESRLVPYEDWVKMNGKSVSEPSKTPEVAPPPQLPIPSKVEGGFTLSEVESFLRSMTTKKGGRSRRVSLDEGPPNPFWTVEPINRQRLDHYGNDGDGWDEDGWGSDYAWPMRTEALNKLEGAFGKGMFYVDVGEKGHIEVQLTAKGKDAAGLTPGKTASLASKIAHNYLKVKSNAV